MTDTDMQALEEALRQSEGDCFCIVEDFECEHDAARERIRDLFKQRIPSRAEVEAAILEVQETYRRHFDYSRDKKSTLKRIAAAYIQREEAVRALMELLGYD